MTNSNWRNLVAVAVALLLGAGAAWAQENTGNIFVKVVDTSGAALPGVTVEIGGFGADQVQITGSSGEARFLKLDPGQWSLSASLDGFSTVEYPAVDVRIARNTSVEVQLNSAIEEEVKDAG